MSFLRLFNDAVDAKSAVSGFLKPLREAKRIPLKRWEFVKATIIEGMVLKFAKLLTGRF